LEIETLTWKLDGLTLLAQWLSLEPVNRKSHPELTDGTVHIVKYLSVLLVHCGFFESHVRAVEYFPGPAEP
jgi:hypothetical protein